MPTPRDLLVVGSLALAARPTTGQHQDHELVMRDIDSGALLGDVVATMTLFKRDDGVVLAGPRERRAHHMTVIVLPNDDGAPYPVKNGGWMTPPLDLESGDTVTMIARDRDGRELFRIEDHPLKRHPSADGQFRPAFGPDWVAYVQIDE